MAIDTTAFTTGAPANTIDITTAGVPRAPNARRTPNAPIAPTVPASRDHVNPRAGNDQSAPFNQRTTSDPMTAVSR